MSSIVNTLLVLLLCCGCGSGSDAPPKATVTGTVTFEEKPLPSGELIFEPADGKGAPTATTITEGKFQFESTLGQQKVKITAQRDTGKTETGASGETINVQEMYLPAKFNSATTLTAEVTDDPVKNVFEFKLTP